jgi:minor extracellular serine protease Vpr
VAPFSSGGVIHHANHAFAVPSLVAPGVAVYSCVPGGYHLKAGTSMATPLVTGCVALLREKYPRATPYDIMDALLSTCASLGASPRERQGAGVVDADAALAYLDPRVPPTSGLTTAASAGP